MRCAAGCLTVLCCLPAAGFAETVVVDLSVTPGPATFRASGFLHSISSTQPAASFVDPVKPRLFRCARSACFNIYSRVTALGAKVQLVMSDSSGYSGNWPGNGGSYTTWETLVASIVNQAATANATMQWDVWNEPNLGQFWGASQAQWLETWRRAVVVVRGLDPAATIVGPSVSGFDQTYLEAFLTYAKAEGVLPDVVSWHEFSGGGSIPANVQTMRDYVAAQGIAISRFSVNEMIYSSEYTQPGPTVHYLAAAERGQVDSAAHACWGDTSGDNCSAKSLDGLLTVDGLQARGSWWAYKGYADVTGQLVDLAPGATVDGVAAYDSSLQTVSLVLGRTGGSGSVDLRLTHLGAAPFLAGASALHVLAKRITDSGTSPSAGPVGALDANASVANDELTVTLPNFSSNDAFTVVLAPRLADGGVPTFDAGNPAADAGAPPADSGVPLADAGGPGADSGVPAVDAGTPPDSGSAPADDAGPDGADAGLALDAGTSGGTEPVSGGCHCSALPGSFLAAAALLSRRHRRPAKDSNRAART